MYWTENPVAMAAARRLCQIIFCLSLTLAWPALLQAEETPAPMEVWLVTYGPGEISWQRFGHNAIWIRDQELGLNHVFNFGFFDFEQESFFPAFPAGKTVVFFSCPAGRAGICPVYRREPFHTRTKAEPVTGTITAVG